MPRKVPCKVSSIKDHGGHVYTVDLAPQAMVPRFRPGQFLHLTVDEYDPSSFWPESRVFSIASSPNDRQCIRICYSVVGRYTRKMEQALRPEGTVWIKLPYGEFVIDGAADAVLVAGGTGISAFTAFIEALAPPQARPVWLIYGARAPELILFQELILGQMASVPGFQVLLFTETDSDRLAASLAAHPRRPALLGGRIDLDAVWARVPQPESKLFYLSGPPKMLATLGAQLKARGLSEDRIRTDAWE